MVPPMTHVSHEAASARHGRPLPDVLGVDEWKPVALTVAQRHDLIHLWSTLMADVYVHYKKQHPNPYMAVGL
jgi:hypothetical protein